MRAAPSKILSREQLAELAPTWREAGLKVVLTNGCFDLLHVGHLRYLQAARQLGDVLVVGVNSDESVRQLKGNARPIVPEAERAELIGGLECVDYVTIFSEPTAVELVNLVQPTYYAKGGDYTEQDLPESEAVIAHGGFVVILPFQPEQSTSAILARIQGSTHNEA
ncbi:MAG: D-glycero-beta-D-manno-heptose 1-phosphate adenylyltransferase [Fimbriimonadales bacterium]